MSTRFITDAAALKVYDSHHRLWQGIPSVEVTAGGRIFATLYSGGKTEENGNFSVLLVSDDDGITWSEPIAAVDVGNEERAYDSCLWIDPLGRLWYIWAVMPNNRIEYVTCEDPDADILRWSEIRTIPGDVMLNKPIVHSDGAWLFPTAVWKDRLTTGSAGGNDGTKPSGAHVYASEDNGQSFAHRGTVIARERWFDEHMLLTKQNGDLEMYIRTTYGVGKAVSHDGGRTFDPDTDSGLGGPNSRFSIGRLSSGNIGGVNHYHFHKRDHLTAMISRDEGETYEGFLMLDERADVSYPDVKEHGGYLYVIYDRERGAQYRPNRDYTNAAREILLAKITEEDILAGKVVSDGSFLAQTVSKLTPGQ